MGLRNLSNDIGLIQISLYNNNGISINEFVSINTFNDMLFTPQASANSCAINTQLQIIKETIGSNLNEDYFAVYAQKHGYFDMTKGTDIPFSDSLLKDIGFRTYLYDGRGTNSLSNDGIRNELAAGKHVIIQVDDQEVAWNTTKEISGIYGHSVRVIGYTDNSFIIRDPGRGKIEVNSDVLQNARDDYGFSAVVVEPPNQKDFQNTHSNLVNKILSQNPNDIQQYRIDEELYNLHKAGCQSDTVSYATAGIEPASSASEKAIPSDIHADMIEISNEVGNIVVTGGYMALMQFLKDRPELQKKVTKVALGIGALDAFTDISADGISPDIDLNPLLITSLTYFISQKMSGSQNSNIKKFGESFGKLAEQSMKVVEYAGYGALGIQTLDVLFGTGLADVVIDLVDSLDFLDTAADVVGAVGDGVDFVEGAATLGLSIALSKLVKWTFKKINKSDVLEVERLVKKTTPKKVLAKCLENEAPIAALIGPYCDMVKGGELCRL